MDKLFSDIIDKEVTLSFEIHKESYSGGIRNISLGDGDSAVTVGGETCYPFYQFEGEMPHKPKIAMEVWDIEPEDWPEAALAPFKDVVSDPVAWAKKCVDDFGADMVVLQLKSTDPNGKDASPEEAAAVVKAVSAAIDVPLIVWGVANVEKDEEVLKKISEECQDKKLTLGPVEDKNHKGIGASAMGYGHTIISSSPIDVNLAKQINILLENLGMPLDRMVIDPTTGGLGYGMEYSFSVMERLRMAALSQGDDKLQYPLINNIGNEVWKCKEAKQSVDEAPTLGDPEKRGVLMEAVAAVSYLMAGSDILILRHPETVRMVRDFIDRAIDGGPSTDIAPINKEMADIDIDLASLAPEKDLTIEEEKTKKAPPPKKEAPPVKKAAPAKPPEPAKEAVPAQPAEPEKEAGAEKAEDDAKAEAELEAKAKADAEAKTKAETEAKAKAEAEAKEKAEAEAKAKADAEAKAEAEEVAEREAGEDAIRQQRAKERDERMAKDAATKDKKVTMTAAKTQRSALSKFKNIRR